MNVPKLHVSLTNSSKEEVLDVLQGISRYIAGIHIEETLLKNEGYEIVEFLCNRYPKMKLIINYTNLVEPTSNLKRNLILTKIDGIIVDGTISLANLNKWIDLSIQLKKKLILQNPIYSIEQLKKLKIENVFIFRPQPLGKTKNWTTKNLLMTKKFFSENISIFFGSINLNNFTKSELFRPDVFVVREELCGSFNPISTCKDITNAIKKQFLNI